MKAIIVIDVDDCINVEPCKADVYVRFPFQSNGWVREYKIVSLKPMPNKLDANDWHRMFGGTYKEREAKGYGWNACLKEVEK